MDYIQILIITSLIIIGIGGINAGMKISKKKPLKGEYDALGPSGMIIAIGIAVLILTGVLAGILYGHAVSLPYNYQASVECIDEMNDYLMKLENITINSGMGLETLGYGFESMEYKKKLAEVIHHKYVEQQQIDAYINNPFNPFRDVMIDGLNKIGYFD